MSDFPTWPKTPRLEKQIAVTEKIDGSNGLVSIEAHPYGTIDPNTPGPEPDGTIVVYDFSAPLSGDGNPSREWHVRAGSRNRWLAQGADNFGFWQWVNENAADLVELGAGRHYGEWYGRGIQRTYGLDERRFALFNVKRWKDARIGASWDLEGYPYEEATQVPDVPGLTTVPLLLTCPGQHMSTAVEVCIGALEGTGSAAVKGFPRPEGVIVYHTGSGGMFKAFTEYGGK